MKRFTQWLEHRWVNPAYVGWLLLGLALFFFAAATNTLAGWLYVISGVMLALLLIAAVLPPRNLQGLVVTRSPLTPVTAGVPLEIELQVRNSQRQTKSLVQLIDPLPAPLGPVQTAAIATLAPGQSHRWRYQVPTTRRGLYGWQTADLRTAAPLGLFWCRRSAEAPATAVVYPQVLALKRCPMLDSAGQRQGQHWRYSPLAKADTQGVTRSLRPYRWGDPTRLIHWRTSARYGELRVRELESITASREVLIGLNTTARWDEASFEQAVVAAASLYAYALKQGFAAALWLPDVDPLREAPRVMHALAAVNPVPGRNSRSAPWPHRPVSLPPVSTLWLTAAGAQSVALSAGSRQLVWGHGDIPETFGNTLSSLQIDANLPLEPQLQTEVS
ncbi:DUF58 domain-containing protein [Nodosilinea sp. PGN35]|uniref:DUF58 domain-containing protein n=1 Tax=Nodosilinea sp. PGN35 TaxID=3020489 RepID=UPI0023B29371|nr:DUF58 domain-containing protein [Nodosilinea sp. TSF1-S3]MDF0365597.1 DUF58 domain-containing protein [Nodosilinea sp. TSF1-S3]